MSGTKTKFLNTILVYVGLAGVLGWGLWFRLRFSHTVHFYPDEFVTLLAVRMIGEKGLPLMPSGLFYDHGLLFSYFGSVAALFGPAPLTVRYLSLFCGLLTVALTFYLGRRWFSPAVGLIAAAGLALAPTAIQWSGRARMYALLQLLVLLTLGLAYEGVVHRQTKLRWVALLTYLAACLTHFVAITLAPPFIIFAIVWWLFNATPHPSIRPPRRSSLLRMLLPKSKAHPDSSSARKEGNRSHPKYPISNYQSPLTQTLALIAILLIAFLVKRLGQPKGIDPLAAQESLSGLAQVFALYSDFSFDLRSGWQAINPFYLDLPALIFVPFALITVAVTIVLYWRAGKNLTSDPPREVSNPSNPPITSDQLPITDYQSPNLLSSFFLTTILLLTTLKMVLFVSPDRRDDKYLFMLLPMLLLLGAEGMRRVGQWSVISSQWLSTQYALRPTPYLSTIASLFAIILIFLLTKPYLNALLANTGDDYATAFAYVQDHWQPADAILTGTPAAAALYLGHNNFYAVQRQGGYDYRLLTLDGQAVDRWLGSPAIRTEAALQQTLAGQRVWLVLERWGLQREYYDLPFQQQLLAQTDEVTEVGAQGIFVLRSKADPRPLTLTPAHPLEATLGQQVQLLGYTVEPEQPQAGQTLRLTLYWQALSPLPHDYTVFVHLRQPMGGNVAQADHRPLGVIYPTTLWPIGETIRESSDLDLPSDLSPSPYQLWTGLYLLETGERLPVQHDKSGENAVQLGRIVVK